SDPRNLRDLLMEVVPDIAARLDFEAVEAVDRSFLMEDWRRREADLFFRIPFRSGEGQPPVLVCVLVEHQSGPDARMPLRTLVYAVLYWEREWKAWEDHHEPGEPLQLTPILPIVFHTGGEPWRTNRTLAELIGGPEEFQAFVPRWHPRGVPSGVRPGGAGAGGAAPVGRGVDEGPGGGSRGSRGRSG